MTPQQSLSALRHGFAAKAVFPLCNSRSDALAMAYAAQDLARHEAHKALKASAEATRQNHAERARRAARQASDWLTIAGELGEAEAVVRREPS